MRFIFFLILKWFLLKRITAFEVPDALVEAYDPSGFSVSIPDEEGIKLFAFHGKINEEMNGREGGVFSRDITKAKNGRWTFYDSQTKLNKGDIIYYWTYVDYYDGKNKLGYPNDDQFFQITELKPKPGPKPPIRPTKPPTQGTTTTTPSSLPPKIDIDGNLCYRTQTTVRTQESCGGKLIFSSNFSPGDFEKFWTVEQRYGGAPDHEFVLYDNDPRVIRLSNGRLVITPNLTDTLKNEEEFVLDTDFDFGERCTAIKGSPNCYQKPQSTFIVAPVTSGQVTTRRKFSFKYGKIEIVAKLPKGDWLYPELFLNSENEEYGPHYESGQIRIAFAPGNCDLNKILEGGVLFGPLPPASKYGVKTIQAPKPWSDEYHTFAVVWSADNITISVDGNVYNTIFPPSDGFASIRDMVLPYSNRWRSGTKMAPFDKEMYITLGVGAGGHYNFEDKRDGSKPWTNRKPSAQKQFYKNRNKWLRSWNEDSKLEVESVKVWSI